jgi:Trk K+ transport system NAD-binding subunit
MLIADDLANIATALTVRAINPSVRIVIRMFNQNLLGRLGQAMHNVYALSTSLLTAPILALAALTGQALGSFRLEGERDGLRQVAEVAVVDGSPLAGRRLREALDPHGVQVLACLPHGGSPQFLREVDPERSLAPGDRVIVCGSPDAVGALLAGPGNKSSSDLLWAGWLRRQVRALWFALNEIDKAVVITTGVLLFVMVVSTLVLHLGVQKYTLADSIYHTIAIMATGGRMPDEDLGSGTLKVFASTLRIVGAALIATFTAIVASYLLRARLGGALEVRRIPDGGHIVICGLNPIGYRVMEVLLASGQQVVVIELLPDNRFVATARRLGAAVIIGDATIPEVLRQANGGTARAVISATSKDLVNLEVALLARELNPAQRVVLLQSDPQLAQMLREAVNVRLAVSAQALAAPAFLATLFGDRVQCAFLVRNRLLTVVDLVVQDKTDPLQGRPVADVARDYRLLPVAALPAQGPLPAEPAGHTLDAGDRLVAIVALSDLEALLRRQPATVPSTPRA